MTFTNCNNNQQQQQHDEDHMLSLYNNNDLVVRDQRHDKITTKVCNNNNKQQQVWNNNKIKIIIQKQQQQQQHSYRAFVILTITILLIINYCSMEVQCQTTETTNNNINNIINSPIELQWDSLEMIIYPKKTKKKKQSSSNDNDNDNDNDTATNKRIILDGSIAGKAIPGRLLGIMGPSGAGKSSVLHALAGLVRDTKNSKSSSNNRNLNSLNLFKSRQQQNTSSEEQLSGIQLYGNRYMNGILVDSGNQQLPYCTLIEQEVNFFPYMTVRETLLFRMQLQFGKQQTSTNTSAEQLVTTILQQMNLQTVANTIVGNTQKVRGISGGERKRLSIAIELINSPSILMLDEPTSGLDSTAAITIIRSLRSLLTAVPQSSTSSNTNTNKTIIAVIHQPSQHIFNLLDDILLIGQGGKQMYYGPRNNVRYYMEQNGCQPPLSLYSNSNTNSTTIEPVIDLGTSTAEFIIDCISIQPIIDWNETIVDAQQRVTTIAQAALIQQLSFNKKPIVTTTDRTTDTNSSLLSVSKLQQQTQRSVGIGILEQYKLLFIRSFREIIRGKTTFILKLIQQMTTAIIYGSIYHLNSSSKSSNINNYGSIIDRFGLLNLIVIGILNLSISKTIRTFPKEKIIISKELSANLYQLVPYFIAKAISEIPSGCIINTIFGTTVYFVTGLQRQTKQYIQFISILVLHGIVTESAGLFISSICPTTDIALAAFPAIIVLSVIFDGRNISEENTPFFFRWVSKVGLIRWALEGLCVNEFTGLQFAANTNTNININKKPTIGQQQVQEQIQRGLLKQLQHKLQGIVVSLLSKTTTTTKVTTTTDGVATASSGMILSGIEALNRFGMGKRTVHDIIRIQIKLISSFWLLSYIGLRLTKQKYVPMQKPIPKS